MGNACRWEFQLEFNIQELYKLENVIIIAIMLL